MSRSRRNSYYDCPVKKESKAISCVCETVKNIDIAQKRATDSGCVSSCEASIKQLFHGKPRKKDGQRFTTVPFMLFNEGSNEAFIGSNVIKCESPGQKGFYYECIESPVFRVQHVDKNCCASLELLLPADYHGKAIKRPTDRKGSCSFFQCDELVTNFIATEICITVDLNKFTGISCLEPITPIVVND